MVQGEPGDDFFIITEVSGHCLHRCAHRAGTVPFVSTPHKFKRRAAQACREIQLVGTQDCNIWHILWIPTCSYDKTAGHGTHMHGEYTLAHVTGWTCAEHTCVCSEVAGHGTRSGMCSSQEAAHAALTVCCAWRPLHAGAVGLLRVRPHSCRWQDSKGQQTAEGFSAESQHRPCRLPRTRADSRMHEGPQPACL